jgi:hypothetical protein
MPLDDLCESGISRRALETVPDRHGYPPVRPEHPPHLATDRLKLTAIRDGLDTLLDEAARRDLTLREAVAFLCEREVARKDERRVEMALKEKLNFFAKPKLLIVDELGNLPFDPNAAHLFFQLVSRRYERGSMLITSNRSVGEWGTVFGDPVVAGTGPISS